MVNSQVEQPLQGEKKCSPVTPHPEIVQLCPAKVLEPVATGMMLLVRDLPSRYSFKRAMSLG